MKYLDVILRS